MPGPISLGIDIGGTFTDFIAVDADTGRTHVWKTLTTPDDPTIGVLRGVRDLFASSDLVPNGVGMLVHATTLITNALIERKGVRTGLITTAGFADLIEIGREVRYDLYDLFLKMPEPLVPADLRQEAVERLNPAGMIVTPLDEASVASAAGGLAGCGVDSIAICFLHSYADGGHERRAAEIIRQRHPGIALSISSEVAGEIREYERFSTTAANAYVQPLAGRYLTDMAASLRETGIEAALGIMLSNGGTTTVGEAARLPVRLIESGPAAGALIGAHYARMLGEPLVLAFDMGGTTAKLCAIEDGRPAVGSGLEVARVHRFKRGSGLPIRAPSVELIEIGAGGGSIARVDELGLLTVGPDSAGADPGPACYGLGGVLPTVTDADLTLGYLNPGYFLGGAMALDARAARAAISVHLSEWLRMDAVQIAAGIHDVVNENMATAAGVYIAERGLDPRRFTLVATGGAGPLHAVEIARKLGIRKVVIPPSAGVASAAGLLVAPPRLDIARSLVASLDELDWQAIARLFDEMEAEAGHTLAAMGVTTSDILIERSVDARYVSQGHEFTVPLPPDLGPTDARARIACEFERVYTRLFGRIVAGVPIECITWRATVRGRDGDLPGAAVSGNHRSVVPTTRPVHFRSIGDAIDTPVYRRGDLGVNLAVDGPAIIEEAQSTTVIGPGDRFEIDRSGNIIVLVREGA
jgi:N-methylhydantoinase A